MLSALKVATPATATAVVVPPRVHVDVIAMESVEPVPEVTTLPFTSSTEALNVVRMVLAVVTAVGGAVVKATRAAAPAVTTMGALVAAVITLEVSVATRAQLEPVLMATKLNVATPATAVAVVVPVRVHVDTSETVSVEPVPVVMGIPLLSSIETAKEGSSVPAATVAGGGFVKATLLGAVVATVITPLITGVNPLSGESVSFAVRAQLVPAVKSTVLNVATPLAAVAVTGLLATVHPTDAVEMAIVSAEPVPAVMTFP
jgi:hypothetical protein